MPDKREFAVYAFYKKIFHSFLLRFLSTVNSRLSGMIGKSTLSDNRIFQLIESRQTGLLKNADFFRKCDLKDPGCFFFLYKDAYDQ